MRAARKGGPIFLQVSAECIPYCSKTNLRFMKTLLLSVCVCLLQIAGAQPIKKYPIAQTGCSAYFYCDPGQFQISYSPDSSAIYQSECIVGDSIAYGLLCVKLSGPVSDLAVAENVLVQYMDYLKTAYQIKSSVGYGKGHRLQQNEQTRGVLDYWEDDKRNNWKVKGWTNGRIIAVLHAFSPRALPETKVNLFLDGFRFE
ncbi:MAG TPA: hypothetical protein DCQ34_07605 [Chitinophagaceae bacterium]|nr:hypothetical protein [Chitinophagaceae bacterium]